LISVGNTPTPTNLQFTRETDKMSKRTQRLLTYSPTGKCTAMGYEAIAGAMSLIFVMVAQMTGEDIWIWHAVAAGMAGIFGTWVFTNPETSSYRQRIVQLLIGTGLASLLGPIIGRAGEYYLPWVGPANYLVSAVAGLLVGIFCTPMLRLMHNPAPALMLLASMLPWVKKKD